MFRRKLLPVWIGILLLSGIYLVGKEPWCQLRPCECAVEQLNSQACQDQAYASVDTLKTCLAACGGDGPCEVACVQAWNRVTTDCYAGLVGLMIDDCGSCGSDCCDYFKDIYPQGCMYDDAYTGTECWDIFMACANGCVEYS